MDNLAGYSNIEIIPVRSIAAIGIVENKARLVLSTQSVSWQPSVTPESITLSHDAQETSALPSHSKVITARIPQFELNDQTNITAYILTGQQCVAIVTAHNGKKWLLGTKHYPLTLLTKHLLPGDASGYTGMEINLSCTSSYYMLELVAD